MTARTLPCEYRPRVEGGIRYQNNWKAAWAWSRVGDTARRDKIKASAGRLHWRPRRQSEASEWPQDPT